MITHETGIAEKNASAQLTEKPSWLFRLELEHLWLAVPLLLVIWISSAVPLPALDFWWHLKSGQIILQSGSIPTTDLFSYTAAGKAYILQNWLAEVLLYLVYRAGGPALVIFFNTLLLVAALVPIYALCLRGASNRRAAVMAACLAAVPLAFQGNIRPQAFSFVMFAWFYFVLVEHQKRRRNLLWLLPVLMTAWVNLHGGFVLGLVLLLLFLVLGWAERITKTEGALTRPELAWFTFAFLLTAGATLLNPQIGGIYRYVATVASDPVSLKYVLEWQPPQANKFPDILRFFGPLFLGLFILARSKPRPGVREVFLFLGFAVFGFTARRNAAWFALVAAPVIASHLHFGNHQSLGSVRQGLSRHLNLLFAGLLVVATLAGLPWFENLRRTQDQDLRLLDPRLPVRAADFISEHRIEGRIFHPQHYGDYMIWRLWPRQLTFLDGRVHLFPMQVADDYFAIQRGAAGWEQTAEKYQIRHLLLDRTDTDEKDLVGAAAGSARWRVLYQDSRSVLFTRTVDANSPTVTK